MERRRASRARRNRLVLAGSVAVSVAVLVAWFPASEILHQRQQLAAQTAQLNQVDHQNRVLAREHKQLETPAAVARIAERQYGLVSPGEQAYQVLPASGQGQPPALATMGGRGSGGAAATRSGTGPGRTSTGSRGPAASGPPGSSGSSGSFLGRVLQTLEFWR